MAVNFKRGQTFDFSGQVMNKGAPYPLSGYTLEADIRTQANFAFVQHMICSILDATTGMIRVYAPSDDTKKWLAMPHLIDIRLKDGAGNVLISNTEEIDVQDTVTQG
ncbi:hypothetical protein SB861_37800 [Paraburkholderia sp. SIMBA_049]